MRGTTWWDGQINMFRTTNELVLSKNRHSGFWFFNIYDFMVHEELRTSSRQSKHLHEEPEPWSRRTNQKVTI